MEDTSLVESLLEEIDVLEKQVKALLDTTRTLSAQLSEARSELIVEKSFARGRP